ncbi:MAG: HAD family hydrolase [Streptosporangiaceae bacterium]
MADQRGPVRAVIFDWGGVLTTPINQTVRSWLDRERIDPDRYLEVMLPWIANAYGPGQDSSPIHALERGEIAEQEFERTLAGLLVGRDGGPVPADGLLSRMFAASRPDTAMLDMVRQLRSVGLRTAMLSNSWGLGDFYQLPVLQGLFDDMVISGQVGMRKPEERIFRLAADRLGLRPIDCVFVDDVEMNVEAAMALGFVGVHHAEREQTLARLARLLDTGAGAPAAD